ncbi:hypothetical protein Vretifemale_11484, partial [Volvox reticuliferus]
QPRMTSMKAVDDPGSFASGIDTVLSPLSLPSAVGAAAPTPSSQQPPITGRTAVKIVSHARNAIAGEEAEFLEEPTAPRTALAPASTDDNTVRDIGTTSVGELVLAPLSAAPSAHPTVPLPDTCAWPAPIANAASSHLSVTTATANAACPHDAISSPVRLTQRQLSPPSLSAAGSNSSKRDGQSRGSFLFCTHRIEVSSVDRSQRSAPSWKLARSKQMRIPIDEGMDEVSHVTQDHPQPSPSLLSHQLQEQHPGRQQRHNKQQEQQGGQQQLMPSCAAAAADLAATWRALEDTLPPPGMPLTASVDIPDNGRTTYSDTDTGSVVDGDTDNRQRSPSHTSRTDRKRFSFAVTSLAQRDTELGGAAVTDGTAAAGGAGSAAAVTAAGLASGKSRARMINGVGSAACELTNIETTLTLGQMLKVAAAAGGGAGGGGGGSCRGIARQWPSAQAAVAALGVGAAAGPPPGIAMAPSGSSLMTSGANNKSAVVAGLIFRGLRVRVGISWALPSASELQYNAAAARMVYGGPCVATCKALADMAHGGQVVMNEAAKDQLDFEGGGTGSGRPSGTMILHLGTYELPRPATGGQRAAGLYSTAIDHPNTINTAATAAAMAAAANALAASPLGLVSSSGVTNTQPDISTGGSLPLSQVLLTGGLLCANDTSQTLSKGSNCGGGAASNVSTVTATRLTAMESRCVYWVTTPSLSPRLAVLPPLRVPPEATPLCDVYDAPFGHVSYAVAQFPAVGILLAWNGRVAEEALLVLQAAAAAQLQRVSTFGAGYRTPSGPTGDRGQICAVFTTAAAAAHWAEGLRRELLTAPWPPELLSHELCEVVEATGAAVDQQVSGIASTKRTRRSSLNACLSTEPEAAGADAANAAVAATPALASTTCSRPQSSTQQHLWTTAPSSSNVGALGCRPGGGGGGSSGARAASGGSFATFLMLRRQECRSRRALSQKGVPTVATGMELSETSGGESSAGEVLKENGSVATPVAEAAAQVTAATTGGAGRSRRQICPAAKSPGLSRHFAATTTKVGSNCINSNKSFSNGGFILTGAAAAGGSSDYSGNGGDGGGSGAAYISGTPKLMGPETVVAAPATATAAEYGASESCVPANDNCREERSAHSTCSSTQGGSMDGSPGLASICPQSPFSAVAAANGAMALAAPPWPDGWNASPRETSLLEVAAQRRVAEAASPRPVVGLRSCTQVKVHVLSRTYMDCVWFWW